MCIPTNTIRKLAISLLHIPIEETKFSFVVTHPFTMSPIQYSISQSELIDLRDEENLKIWYKEMEDEINTISSVNHLVAMLSNPYKLYFINLIRTEISNYSLGKLLSENWSLVENNSRDCNVSLKELVSMFKVADKIALMDGEELIRYNTLPDTVTLYRGVISYNKDNIKALSWTSDKEQALWFANRFDIPEKELWTITIPKHYVLACYSYEEEYIVDLLNYDAKINIEEL